MAKDKQRKSRPLPVPPAVDAIVEPVEAIESPVVDEPTIAAEVAPETEMDTDADIAPPTVGLVTPETATHVAVMTRGQARFPRIGFVFTPDVVEIDLVREWPNEVERAKRIRSLVCESGPNGALEVEFIVK
jgi:hypothetical protein